jgi:HemX protein
VSWLTDKNYFLAAVLFYGFSTLYSVFLWRKGFRQDNRINYGLLLAAFTFHSIAMMKRGFSFARCPVNNLYEATIFLAWTMVAAYLLVGVWWRLRFLGAFASPVLFSIGVFALMPHLDPPYADKPQFQGALPSIHAALILLAYGSFGLSSVAGLMYLTQEHDLKFHKLRAIFARFPPIQRLERVISILLWVGFVLLSVGLVTGGLYLKQTDAITSKQDLLAVLFDAKILWSLLVWVIYFGLLLMHWRFAQTGRRFVWGAVGSFAFVLLTFWGTNLLSAIHQQ